MSSFTPEGSRSDVSAAQGRDIEAEADALMDSMHRQLAEDAASAANMQPWNTEKSCK